MKYSKKFSFTESSYATAFSKCKTSRNVRYGIVCKTIYEHLEGNNLKMKKVNENNYLQATEVRFLQKKNIALSSTV